MPHPQKYPAHLNYFYFGVLYPVARIISGILEELSFATTFQGVYFIF
jgi:hypothetical protein